MNNNKLGELIYELRKSKGLKQKELADLLFVTDKAVSRWERGHSLPDIDKLVLISEIFDANLNDLITLRTGCAQNNEELVKDMIKKFTEANKRNAKRMKVISLFALFIVLILILAIIFFNSYNRFKVYNVTLKSDEFISISGTYVETRIRDSLNLGDIKIIDTAIKENDIVSVDLYIKEDKKEKILYTYSRLNRINFVSSQSYYEIDDLSNYFDKIYLKVTIIDSKNNVKEYKTKLQFVLDFSNNKIFNNENNHDLTNNKTKTKNIINMIDILLKNDFEKIDDNRLIKRNKKTTITYFNDSNKINLIFENNNLSYRYNYYYDSDVLEVQVFDENTTEISNYKYNVKKDKVTECNVGKCNDYKYAIDVLNKNILNLLK